MGNIKQVNVKNWTYYFYKDIIKIKNLDSNFSKTDKKCYKNITKILHWIHNNWKHWWLGNIYSVNPLYLIVNTADAYIEGKNGSKYLTFDSKNENKEVFKKYAKLSDEIKYLIKTINYAK